MNAPTTPQWHPAKTGNHQGLVIDDNTGANIAVTYDKAHASLVAAAPQLLRELKSAIFYIETYGGEVTTSFASGGNLRATKQLIAEAEGRD